MVVGMRNNKTLVKSAENTINAFLSEPNKFVTTQKVYNMIGMDYNSIMKYGSSFKMNKDIIVRYMGMPLSINNLHDLQNIAGWLSDENGKQFFVDFSDFLKYDMDELIKILKSLLEAEWL